MRDSRTLYDAAGLRVTSGLDERTNSPRLKFRLENPAPKIGQGAELDTYEALVLVRRIEAWLVEGSRGSDAIE